MRSDQLHSSPPENDPRPRRKYNLILETFRRTGCPSSLQARKIRLPAPLRQFATPSPNIWKALQQYISVLVNYLSPLILSTHRGLPCVCFVKKDGRRQSNEKIKCLTKSLRCEVTPIHHVMRIPDERLGSLCLC